MYAITFSLLYNILHSSKIIYTKKQDILKWLNTITTIYKIYSSNIVVLGAKANLKKKMC